MTPPFQVEEDGNYLWVTDKHGFCLVRTQWKFPGQIAEFTPDDVRAQMDFIGRSHERESHP